MLNEDFASADATKGLSGRPLETFGPLGTFGPLRTFGPLGTFGPLETFGLHPVGCHIFSSFNASIMFSLRIFAEA